MSSVQLAALGLELFLAGSNGLLTVCDPGGDLWRSGLLHAAAACADPSKD